MLIKMMAGYAKPLSHREAVLKKPVPGYQRVFDCELEDELTLVIFPVRFTRVFSSPNATASSLLNHDRANFKADRLGVLVQIAEKVRNPGPSLPAPNPRDKIDVASDIEIDILAEQGSERPRLHPSAAAQNIGYQLTVFRVTSLVVTSPRNMRMRS